MRFIVLVKASKQSESGAMPTERDLAEMGAFNEKLVKAGLMLAGEGLHPSSEGTRLAFSGGNPKIVNGPFAATEELVAGYWILKASSKDEVIQWMKQAPFQDGVIEIRQITEDEEFAYAPEAMAREKRMREQIARQQRH